MSVLSRDKRVASVTVVAPEFWGSWKGRVIKAIVIDGAKTWNEILSLTGLSPESLNTALSELYDYSAIHKNPDDTYSVLPPISKEYRQFFNILRTAAAEKKKQSATFSRENQDELASWIGKWKEVKGLDFSLEHKHFFLWGRYLDGISKDLISRARSEVLVVNPYVDNCDLSNTLREASKRGTKVELITRPPTTEKDPSYRKEKQDYHRTLRERGITLTYNRRVHAKLIAVDRAVAVVSSMNFHSASSAGSSWEAGLITTEKAVVESIVNYILGLTEKPESIKLGVG